MTETELLDAINDLGADPATAREIVRLVTANLASREEVMANVGDLDGALIDLETADAEFQFLIGGNDDATEESLEKAHTCVVDALAKVTRTMQSLERVA